MKYCRLIDTVIILVIFAVILQTSHAQGTARQRTPNNQRSNPRPQGRNAGRETEREGSGDKAKFPLAYVMADGAEEVIGGPAQETFTCEGRDYGYYADMQNNCQLYHVCVPPNQQYTFFCNNGTVFDQKALVCVREEDSTPCGNSEKYYALNQNFGVVDNNALLLLD